MSVDDLDRAAGIRRMKDYLKPEEMDNEGCVRLATELLAGMADDLKRSARRYAEFPNQENAAHLKTCRDMYGTDLFAALSCGTVDGKVAAKRIIKDALRGKKLE